MTGEKLHDYDEWLCEYVLGNIRQYMDRPAFAACVEQQLGPGPLLDYLKEGLAPGAEQERLLLNDDELQGLVVTFLGGPAGLDRAWLPYVQLHGWYIRTVREVREELS